MLGLQLDNKIAAIQIFLVFLKVQQGQNEGEKKLASVLSIAYPVCVCVRTHGEVETFRLLLIGSSLTDVCLAHVGVGGGWFHWLGGLAMLEGLGNVKVFHSEHVLKGLHGCVKRLPNLTHTKTHTNSLHLLELFCHISVTRKGLSHCCHKKLQHTHLFTSCVKIPFL